MDNTTISDEIDTFENLFRINHYYGQKDRVKGFLLQMGKGQTIVSTPHSCRHLREQNIKAQEYMTGAIGMYVREKTNCHLISSVRFDNCDPNWDEISPYRNELIETIRKENIHFLLDLHGMKDSFYDIEFGTNDLANIDYSTELKKLIADFWKSCGYRIRFDGKFKASRPTCVSNSIHMNTGIFCLQMEISSSIRSFAEKTLDFSNKMALFIELLNAILVLEKKDINKTGLRNESWWPLNYLVVPKNYIDRIGLPNNALVSFALEEVESYNCLQLLSSDCLSENDFHISPSYLCKMKEAQGFSEAKQKYWLLRKTQSYEVKDIRKVESSSISDDTIQVDATMFSELHEKGIKYVKVINIRLGTSAGFRFTESYKETTGHRQVWIGQRSRSLLGIEIKKRYPWYEYKRILSILDESDKAKGIVALRTFFRECFYPINDDKEYEQYVDANNLLNTKLKQQGENGTTEKDLRISFKSLFPILVVGSSISNKVEKDIIADSLVGFSKQRFLSGRIDDVLEATNNIKINSQTATIIDVQSNERLIIYHGKKKKSCRVIIDDMVDDNVIQMPKRIRSHLSINSEKTLVEVKRDNWNIIGKKMESIILSIALTSFTVINFFSDFIKNKIWIASIVIGICILIVSSSFSDRRKNVK